MDYEVRKKDDTPIFESVVEYDPDTCRYIIARHPPELVTPPPHDFSPPDNIETLPSVVQAMAPTAYSDQEVEYALGGGGGWGGGTGGVCSARVGSFVAGQQWLWTEDPPGIKVSESDHVVTFTYDYDAQCVSWMRSQLWSKAFASSGWQVKKHNHATPRPRDPDWNSLEAWGYSEMENLTWAATFCPTSDDPTYTYYANYMYAYYDGYKSWHFSSWDSGGCSYLLGQYRYYF